MQFQDLHHALRSQDWADLELTEIIIDGFDVLLAKGSTRKSSSPMEGQWRVVPLAVLLLFSFRSARADVQPLACNDGPDLRNQGIFWECQNFGKVVAKGNTTYYLTVDPESAAYQQFDINITLTSINGDADL